MKALHGVAVVAMSMLAAPTMAQVKVVPTVTRTVAVFDVTSSDPAAKVTGVYLDNSLATCKAQDTDSSPQPIDVDASTVKTLSSAHWIVTCSRKLKESGATTISPPFDISFATTTGPVAIPVPADSLLPYNTASQMQEQIASINSRFQKIRLSTTQAGYPNGNPAGCPAGTYDSGWINYDTWPGGHAGQGHKYRVCIQVGE